MDLAVHDLRDFTTDRHRVVDDVPYGGGPGMVLKPEPLFARGGRHPRHARRAGAVVLTSPQGRRFTQAEAARLRGLGHVVMLCGRYEGVDDRVREHLATEEMSIGDYVLSGGELAALVIVDAVAGSCRAWWATSESVAADSFSRGLLDYPHYTRPAEFRGWKVPDVLVSGHHARIDRWRRREALRRTLRERPDLLAGAHARRRASGALLRELSEEKERIMSAIETVERTQLVERPQMKSGRHRARAREGARGRQGTRAGVRGHRHRHAPRRRARLVHGAQGLVRPGRRAHLPAALADDPEGGRRAVGPGAPRQAVLPARSEGQGRAHEGNQARQPA